MTSPCPDIPGPRSEDGVIRRVLIVDDSRLQRHLLTLALKQWGLRVAEAASGEEALTMCRADPPDLVLSDWMMPGMDGLEFCRKFRKLDRDSYGYFILLTSKSGKCDIATGLDTGADDFLTKPFDLAELRARISAGARILRMERELSKKNQLITSTLDELQALYDSIDSDLIEARKLQQSLVSERHRDFGTAQVSMVLRPSGHVGGDLVGLFAANAQRIGVYGIDVSGHGISSALMTARLAGYLSAAFPEQNIALMRDAGGDFIPRPPAETLAALNSRVLSDMQTEHYCTILLADVNLETGQVVMAQAGHPYPAVQRAGGRVEFVGAGGYPVGLIDGAEYEQFEIRLAPGDRLMIHSDGVVECADRRGAPLGEAGLSRILGELDRTHGMAALESLVWKLTAYSGDQDFADDVSAVLLEFKPETWRG